MLSEDLPLHRYLMRTWRHKRAQRWWDLNDEFRAYILGRLRADGPLPLREIEDRSVAPWLSIGWTGSSIVSRMLDMMWVRGHVGIAGRAGGQRQWDLMERCLPAHAPDEELSEEEVTRRAAPKAIRALGAARIPHIRAHFTRNRYPRLQQVLESHPDLRRIEVEGLGDDWWIHVEDLETLDADFRGRIEVEVSVDERFLTICVTDNGVGLPQGVERIMEPYVTTREKGTGLGLAIVKKIVEEHGGELNFAPGPEGGTSATLRFARDPAAAIGSEAAE